METNRDRVSPEKNSRFKSYYVVWKPVFRYCVCYPFFCLNRTMQYGNGEWCENSHGEVIGFKSYYVVWKHEDPPNTKNDC